MGLSFSSSFPQPFTQFYLYPLPLRLYQSLQVLDHVQHSFAPYPELTIQNSVDRFHDQLTGCILEHQTTGTQLQCLYDLFLLDEQLQG
jgi:hypothetical protein